METSLYGFLSQFRNPEVTCEIDFLRSPRARAKNIEHTAIVYDQVVRRPARRSFRVKMSCYNIASVSAIMSIPVLILLSYIHIYIRV